VRRGARLALVLSVVLVSLRCVGRPATQHPVPQQSWHATLAYVQQCASNGQYPAADSALVAFAGRYPNTPEATETRFWLALVRLDPRNEHHSASEALRDLSAYDSGAGPRAHDLEAGVLVRTATALLALREETAQATSQADSARTEADSVRTTADSARLVRASRDRSREEVARLRDSLDKVVGQLSETTQELDRIKKRLAAPKDS
jgi:hypothetical protein